MKQWTLKRNICLDELHRHDGFIAQLTHCSGSACENLLSPASSFRCLDCLPHAYKCESCLVGMHVLEPFHRIEVRIIQVFTFNYASYPHNLSFAALEREILVEDDPFGHRIGGEPGTWNRYLSDPPYAPFVTCTSSTRTAFSPRKCDSATAPAPAPLPTITFKCFATVGSRARSKVRVPLSRSDVSTLSAV